MEAVTIAESRHRILTKIIRFAYMTTDTESLIDTCFQKGLNEIFSLWIKDF